MTPAPDNFMHQTESLTTLEHIGMSYFKCFSVTLMLRFNLTKSDEIYLFHTKCRLGFCAKLRIAVHK